MRDTETKLATSDLEQEFRDVVYRDGRGSVDIALETIKGQIAWLEYVPERELIDSERERILLACQRFFNQIRPLTHKYID